METIQAKDSTCEAQDASWLPGIGWAPGKGRNIQVDNMFTALLVGNKHDDLQWMEGWLTNLPVRGQLQISPTQTKGSGGSDIIADQVCRIGAIKVAERDL